MNPPRPPADLAHVPVPARPWWRTRRGAWGLTAGVLLGAGLGWGWYLRPVGPTPVERWKASMRARGERFEFEELLRGRVPVADDGMAAIQVAAGWLVQAQALPGAGPSRPPAQAPGTLAVATQQPTLEGVDGRTYAWAVYEAWLDAQQTNFAALHAALAAPVADPGWVYPVGTRSVGGFVQKRLVGQGLANAALGELHRGRGAAARAQLMALGGLVRLHREGYLVTGQMIRVALAGLWIEVAWQGLQTSCWTATDLEAVQSALAEFSFLPELIRTLEVERAEAGVWFAHLRERGMAAVRPWTGPGGGRAWRMVEDVVWVPAWRALWSQRDELDYLEDMQATLDALRRAEREGAFEETYAGVLAGNTRLRRRTERELVPRHLGTRLVLLPAGKLVHALARNLVRQRLCLAALALKRFQLAHGHLPERLEELVPRWLEAVPADWVDGRPLRYRREADGAVRLWSMGLDGRDGGGDPASDWVWEPPARP